MAASLRQLIEAGRHIGIPDKLSDFIYLCTRFLANSKGNNVSHIPSLATSSVETRLWAIVPGKRRQML